MDELPLQRRINFLISEESLEMIFSRYTESFEVPLDNSKVGGENIEDFAKKDIMNIFHENQQNNVTN